MGRHTLILQDVFNNLKIYNQQKIKLEQNDNHNTSEYDLVCNKLLALEEIDNYIQSYVWVTHTKYKERIEVCQKCEYDITIIAEHLRTTKRAVAALIHRANQTLKESIGETTIREILRSEDFESIEVAMGYFRGKTQNITLESLLLNELQLQLPASTFKYYNISECTNELRFLYNFSKIAMEFELMDMDKEKLSFIRYILNEDTEVFKRQKSDFFAVLQGEKYTIDEYLKNIQNAEE